MLHALFTMKILAPAQVVFDICNKRRIYPLLPPTADLTGFGAGKLKLMNR
jgi:hypothetical protein